MSLQRAVEIINEAQKKGLTSLDLSGLQLTSVPAEITKLTNLQDISLADNSLNILPAGISRLFKLTSLSLDNNQFSSLPLEITEITGLQKLILNRNQLTTLPQEIANLTNLKRLSLDRNKLTLFPYDILKINKLNRLDIDSNQLTSLPNEISSLENLQILYINNNRIKTLPIEIGKLTALQILHLSSNQLSALPLEIMQLSNLRELHLNSNEFPNIPLEITQLLNLETLSLNENKLTNLPLEIAHLTNLQVLWLNNNLLSKLPIEITSFINLRSLFLEGNLIDSVPEEIIRLRNLMTLDLDRNNISIFPLAITHLINLNTLYLSKNKLFILPDEIGRLKKLRHLSLSGNKLTKLPNEFRSLTNLHSLNLQGNPLPLLPEVLKKQDDPSGLLALYFQQQVEETRPLCEAKMLLVGQGYAGKTSLVRALKGEFANPREPKTDGISIQQLPILIGSEAITVNIWDFGGQEIMHATHQFFLTERSLYILVVNARQDERENRIEYWLKLIQTFGGNAPVLIVVNKSEEHSLDLDQPWLMRKYPNIKGIYRTVACPEHGETRGIEELRKAIANEIDAFENLRTPLPLSCYAVKQYIEESERDFLSEDEYDDICSQCSVPVVLRNTLLDLLNDLGTALNYRQHKRFDISNTNVLNPDWVTRGVYRILNYLPSVWNQQAILETSVLAKILSPSHYPVSKYPFLLGMMEEFELCYCMDGDKRSKFLLPDLLPPSEPDTGDWKEKLLFEYHYDVWIQSIFTRFIVRMSQHISSNTVWRKGVLLRYEGMRAMVKIDEEDRRLSIWIEGPANRRRELLAIIRREFSAIHKSFEDLRTEEKVPIPGHSGVYVGYQHLLNLEDMDQVTYIPEGMKETINVYDLLDGIVVSEDRKRDQLAKGEMIMQNEQNKQVITEPLHKVSPWQSGSFYLVAFVMILGLAIIAARYLPWLAVPTVFIFVIVGVGVVGAFQLRHDGNLSEKGFLSLMLESYKQLPLLISGKKSKGQTNNVPLPNNKIDKGNKVPKEIPSKKK